MLIKFIENLNFYDMVDLKKKFQIGTLPTFFSSLKVGEKSRPKIYTCYRDETTTIKNFIPVNIITRLPKVMALKARLLPSFLSLFIAKNRENLGIGMKNRQRDGFF